MAQILFKNETDINNDWLFYIENEAKSLAQRDDFAIRNYLDREIFNPEVQSYLTSDNLDVSLRDAQETENLSLNFIEEKRTELLSDELRPRFGNLKEKIRSVFCRVVRGIGQLDTKDIIKAVLVALIPMFASGLPAAVLPIVIGLVAYLIKYGIERTCPV